MKITGETEVWIRAYRGIKKKDEADEEKMEDPVRGGPRLPAPFEIWHFSPGSLNYYLDAPQIIFRAP